MNTFIFALVLNTFVSGNSNYFNVEFNQFNSVGSVIEILSLSGQVIYTEEMGMQQVEQKRVSIAHIENGKYPHVQMIHVSPNYTCVVDGKMFSL